MGQQRVSKNEVRPSRIASSRIPPAGAGSRYDYVLGLQRTAGNRAVTRLLASILPLQRASADDEVEPAPAGEPASTAKPAPAYGPDPDMEPPPAGELDLRYEPPPAGVEPFPAGVPYPAVKPAKRTTRGGGIPALDLEAPARVGAEELLRRQPDVVFTSGRRDVPGQARAMAGNVVKNRKWIAKVYSNKELSGELQAWVDSNPTATTKDAIAAGLNQIMSGWPLSKLGRLTAHFHGRAFDVQPVGGARGEAIKASIRSLPGLKQFLEKEGQLVRWHVQLMRVPGATVVGRQTDADEIEPLPAGEPPQAVKPAPAAAPSLTAAPPPAVGSATAVGPATAVKPAATEEAELLPLPVDLTPYEKDPVILETLAKANTTPQEWYKHIVPFTFKGIKISAGVHVELARKLREAEKALTEFTADELGLKPHLSTSGLREGTYRKSGLHRFGLAVDFNIENNPYLGAHVTGTEDDPHQAGFEVAGRAGLLVLGQRDDLSVKKGDEMTTFDRLQTASDAFVKYFALSPAEVAARVKILDEKGKNLVGFTPDRWVKQIAEDREALKSIPGRETDFMHNKSLNKGFIDLRKPLVKALVDVGLTWLGHQFPGEGRDVQHFDWRRGSLKNVLKIKMKKGKEIKREMRSLL